jgi:hypothetical protein
MPHRSEAERRAIHAKGGSRGAARKRVPLTRATPTVATVPGVSEVLDSILDPADPGARVAVVGVLKRFTVTQLETYDDELRRRLADALFDHTDLPMKAIQEAAKKIMQDLVPKSTLARLKQLQREAKKKEWKNRSETEGYLEAIYLMESRIKNGQSTGDVLEGLRRREKETRTEGRIPADFLAGARRATQDLEGTYWGEA